MSWWTSAINAFASGAGGAAVQSSLPTSPTSNPGYKTATKAQEAASSNMKSRSSCTKNGSQDLDDVLMEAMDGNLGKAWGKWCEATKSDKDPVTGESRGGQDNDDRVGSRDKN